MSGIFKTISNQDRTQVPFKAYKNWEFSDANTLQTFGSAIMTALKPNKNVYSGNIVPIGVRPSSLDYASNWINVYGNEATASVLWYSLDHLYYKGEGQPFNTFGNTNHESIRRRLYSAANVISLSQKTIGEGIKPNSFSFNASNANYTYNIVDDGNGNLIDTDLSGSISNQVFYLRMHEMEFEKDWVDNDGLTIPIKTNTGVIKTTSSNKELQATYYNTVFSEQISTGSMWGIGAHFNNTGYIRIPNNDILNFKQSDDFTIGFWFNIYSPSSSMYLLNKSATGKGNVLLDNGTLSYQDIQLNASQYPFDIYYIADTSSAGTLYFKCSTGGATTTLSTYLNFVNFAQKIYLTVSKTDSLLQLYINGKLINYANLDTNGNIQNNADIFLGCKGLDSSGNPISGLFGSISDFIVFNRGLTLTEIQSLASDSNKFINSTNTNIVGNIFYEHGIAIISDPRPKYTADRFWYRTLVNNNNNYEPVVNELISFYFTYASTVTIYENEVTCRINQDEFNFTLNPTIREDSDTNSQVPKDFVNNPAFSPYITTVGLYNNRGELVAVAKLHSPVKKRDNVDLNIVVRYDF